MNTAEGPSSSSEVKPFRTRITLRAPPPGRGACTIVRPADLFSGAAADDMCPARQEAKRYTKRGQSPCDIEEEETRSRGLFFNNDRRRIKLDDGRTKSA